MLHLQVSYSWLCNERCSISANVIVLVSLRCCGCNAVGTVLYFIHVMLQKMLLVKNNLLA